jgi:hypothetical protein
MIRPLAAPRRAVTAVGSLVLALGLAACSSPTTPSPGSVGSGTAAGSQGAASTQAVTSGGASVPSAPGEASAGTGATGGASAGGGPAASSSTGSSGSAGEPNDPATRAVADFKAWMAAVNAGNTNKACRYLTAKQAQKMVDELAAGGSPIKDCAGMVEFTSKLYAAAGHQLNGTVKVRKASPTSVTLWVDYDNDCGLVVMEPGNGHWVINEQSQEQC